MKHPTLYIPVNLRMGKLIIDGVKRRMVNNAPTLLNARKILILEKFLPTLSQLQNHLIYERRACQLFDDRKPQPLAIVVDKPIFNEILKEISRKGEMPEEYKERIPLILQSGNIPIAVILPRDEEIV